MPKSVFIVSGEESGDLHGSSLIKALKELVPGLEVGGMGGRRMREAGQVGLDSSELSVVGIVEVIEKSPGILKAFRGLKKRLKEARPDAVVLIDFPDFNLRLAREAKKLGIPVVYYISPQVWAWRKGRIKKIARLVDKMLVVFPFEVDLYRKEGVDVEYVGHPLSDVVECPLSKDEARKAVGVGADSIVVSLLPGSRTAEVRRHLPVMLEAAVLMEKGINASVDFLLPAAHSIDDTLLAGLIGDSRLGVKVLRERLYTALRASDAAVVASGTATLETALVGTPMVIIYRMSQVSYAIGRALVGVSHIGLPNIVAGREVVKELIQNDATPEKVCAGILEIIKDSGKKDDIINGLKEIKDRLGSRAASRAARAVFKVINP